MKSSVRAKRHHSVPQFYLKKFADSEGTFWLHDLSAQTARRVHPRAAMVEKYLYSPEVGDDPYDDTFERFLSLSVEAPAATALKRLGDGEPISDEERMRIATFLAFQEWRLPRMQRLVKQLVAEVGQRMLELSAGHPEQIRRSMEVAGEVVPERVLNRIVSLVKEGGLRVEATKIGWLEAASGTDAIRRLIYQMPWFVAEARAGIEFLTSDEPIVKVLTDRSVPRHFAGGWASPSAEATFALNPRRCLVIRPSGREGRGVVQREWCKNVNIRVITYATRFVVSRSRDAYVESVAERRAKFAMSASMKPDAGTNSQDTNANATR